MGQRHTSETREAVMIQNWVSQVASISDHSSKPKSRAEGRRDPWQSSLRLAYSNMEGLTILLLMKMYTSH